MWVVLQPLMPAVIFAFVFGVVVRVSTGPVPYLLFTFAGFMTWNLFQRVILQAGNCLVLNGQLISKTYFPRILLPLAAVPVALLDFLVATVLMAGLMLYYKTAPWMGIFLLPVWIGLLLVLVVGIGLIAASLAVRYRDVQHALPILMPMLMYLSPIAYPASMVPRRVQPFYNLNPLVSILEAVRWSVLGIGELHWGYLAYTATVASVALVVGLMSIKRVEGKIADVI
jgi:lipopolysaccharide transport system permease protein